MARTFIHISFRLLTVLFIISATACVSTPYEQPNTQVTHYNERAKPLWSDANPQIAIGKPNAVLDAADWYWPGSLLSKLILWDTKIDSHQVSEKTVNAIDQYLTENQLDAVKVRINQYAPRQEFKRLINNKAVGAGWRYSIGLLSWLNYTIFPGRFFGGDRYNPYTNTISIFSDLDVIGLHEGGHAKDSMKRKYPGTYGFLYGIPGVPLYSEAKASNDAISYARSTGNTDQEIRAYKKLYPAYGTYVGGILTGEVAGVALGALGGHIIGQIRAKKFSRTISRSPENDH